MSYSKENEEDIKKLIFKVIDEFKKNNEDKIYLLHDCFILLQNSSLRLDFSFYQNVFDKLKPYDQKDIIDAIVYSIPEGLIASNLTYFFEILDKSIGIKKWIYHANTRNVISRKESVFGLFKKIEDPEILLDIYEFLIERHKNDKIKESLIKDFLLYLKSIFVNNTNIKNRLTLVISSAVISDKIRYYEDDLLVDLVKSCQIEEEVFFQIFNTLSGNYYQKNFLVEIVNKKFFSAIVEKYNSGGINDDFLQGFRNILSIRNIDLSIVFEKVVESNSKYKFADKIDKGIIERRTAFLKNERQREFDVLFEIKKLEMQMIEIFKFKKKKELSYKDMSKFYEIFYRDNEIRENVTVRAKDLLWEIIRKEIGDVGFLNIEALPHYLQKYDLEIIVDIKNALPKDNEQNFIVLAEQKAFIENWCVENTPKVKLAYSNYMLNGTLFSEEEHLTFNTIFEFQKYFKFNLDEELLLNMIWLSRYQDDMNLEFIDGIVSEKKINERIIENVNRTNDENSIYSYIKYFVENKIDLKLVKFDIRTKIKDLLLTDNEYFARKLIELLYDEDIPFLQEVMEFKYLKPKRYFLDFVLNLLIKQNRFEIVENYLKSNYSRLISEELLEEIKIIRILVLSNSDLGFSRLRTLIEKSPKQYVELGSDFRNEVTLNFSNKESIDDLIAIFHFGVLTYSQIKLSRVYFSPIRIASEAIINICKNQDVSVCEDVLKKLNGLNTDEIENHGGDLFYVNKLIKDIEEIVLNHKSVPYSLKQVLKTIEDYKYAFR